MSTSPTPAPQPRDDDLPATPPTFAANPPLAPSLDDQLREFWDRYSKGIYTLVVIVLLGILAKGGYEYYLKAREESIARSYNAAATNDQLRSFAAENSSHTLGGLASLRLADDAYSNSKYTEAATYYDRAAAALPDGPLGGRARLGAGVSRLLAGQASEGEKNLSALAADVSQLKTVRAEAAYHLGSHLLSTGRTEDGNKALEQAAAIDPTSAWADRAVTRKDSSAPKS